MGNLFCFEQPDPIEYVVATNLTEMMNYLDEYNASEKFLYHISNIEKKYSSFMLHDRYRITLSESFVLIVAYQLIFDVFKKYGKKPFTINEKIISFIVSPEPSLKL